MPICVPQPQEQIKRVLVEAAAIALQSWTAMNHLPLSIERCLYLNYEVLSSANNTNHTDAAQQYFIFFPSPDHLLRNHTLCIEKTMVRCLEYSAVTLMQIYS
jgi:hypothetical protein